MSAVLESINSFLGSFTAVVLLISGIVLGGLLFRYLLPCLGKFIGAIFCKKSLKGEKTPLGSLCLALAGTLGVGNISGVAAAIASGGAGAIFWMWICAIFCAVLKYSETVLAVKYRMKKSDGYEGGVHRYISNGLGVSLLGAVFCVLCVFSSFTTGNITQAKAAADGMNVALSVPPYICGVVLFILLMFFCRNGSSGYSFTLRLIPILCLGYIFLCLDAIIHMREGIYEVTKMIFSQAFTPRAGMGGIIGIICSRAVRFGITRGVMSNEAGCGTAPIAHAAANTEDSALQGFLGIVEVLFDTLILCTLTAYVILLSDADTEGVSATAIALKAFSKALGNLTNVPLSLAMLLFAAASAVGWNYYGRVSLSALGASEIALKIYNFVYALSAFFGSLISETLIWQLSDLSICLMAIINTACVLLLSHDVVAETKRFKINTRKKLHSEVHT